jgi:hypothetical protein
MRKGDDPDLQDETLWRARRLKASYALRPKASRRNDGSTVNSPRGCLKFEKVRGTPMQRVPYFFVFRSYPPGLRWDPLSAYVRAVRRR